MLGKDGMGFLLDGRIPFNELDHFYRHNVALLKHCLDSVGPLPEHNEGKFVAYE